VAVEVALGTGMSCISSVGRGEDNGSDKDDQLDDRRQGRTPGRLSVPCGNRVIQTDMHARLPLLALNGHALARHWNVCFEGQSRHRVGLRLECPFSTI
jgi:hypothetical protein